MNKSTHDQITNNLNDSSSSVRLKAIQNPNATDAHISKALGDSFHEIRLAAVMHPNATSNHINTAMKDSGEIRRAAMKHPNVSTENINNAIDDPNPNVRVVAAIHSKTTPEQLTKFMQDKDSYVRRSALHNPNVTNQHIAMGMDDPDENIRHMANRINNRINGKSMNENIAGTAALIDSILNKSDDFKNVFKNIVSQKVNDALENRKREMSSSLVSESSDIPFGARKLYVQTYHKYGKTLSKSKEAEETAYDAVQQKYGDTVLNQLKKYHEKNMNEAYGDDDEFDSNRFANRGSALYPSRRGNPRIYPCPNCNHPNRLTRRDVSKGYQCDNCADAYENGTEIHYYDDGRE